jgi:hypothetical protein
MAALLHKSRNFSRKKAAVNVSGGLIEYSLYYFLLRICKPFSRLSACLSW